MPYCPKCGKEVKDDAVFCSYCSQNLKPERDVVYRRSRDEKNEKNEKGEKNEKDVRGEKGEKNEGQGSMWNAVMGGLILLWLGVTFLLQQYNYIPKDEGGWFLAGIGVILILRGILQYTQTSNWRTSSGWMIGGAILLVISIGSYVGWANWWPYIIIFIGLLIVLNALISRDKNPRP